MGLNSVFKLYNRVLGAGLLDNKVSSGLGGVDRVNFKKSNNSEWFRVKIKNFSLKNIKQLCDALRLERNLHLKYTKKILITTKLKLRNRFIGNRVSKASIKHNHLNTLKTRRGKTRPKLEVLVGEKTISLAQKMILEDKIFRSKALNARRRLLEVPINTPIPEAILEKPKKPIKSPRYILGRPWVEGFTVDEKLKYYKKC